MTESARIASLETQVRTLKRMLFGVFGLVVAGAVLGATSLQTVPDVIQAKQFEVVNDQGKILVGLGNFPGGGVDNGMIVTRNSVGGELFKVTPGPYGNRIRNMDAKGNTLVEIAASTEGGGFVMTNDSKGKKLVSIGGTKGASAGTITTYNGKDRTLVAIGTRDGNGVVVTQDGFGKNLVVLDAVDGTGVVATMNGKGEFTSFTPEEETPEQ